jgi:hypothetical protein
MRLVHTQPQDMEVLLLDNARRAYELNQKSQLLAQDEYNIMNQAINLHLLARHVAEVTMRPNLLQQTVTPLYVSLQPGQYASYLIS